MHFGLNLKQPEVFFYLKKLLNKIKAQFFMTILMPRQLRIASQHKLNGFVFIFGIEILNTWKIPPGSPLPKWGTG